MRDSNYKEIHQNEFSNVGDINPDWESSNINTEPRRYPQKRIIFSWKIRENWIPTDKLPESSLTKNTSIIHLLKVDSTLIIDLILESPKTFKKTLAKSDKDRWLNAIRRELKIFLTNKTWRNIKRNEIKKEYKILSGKWIFTIKKNEIYKTNK
jgi:hypothetical protein